VTFAALGAPVPIRRIALVALAAPAVRVSGSVKGSPLVAGTWYAGFEHPLATSETDSGRARSSLPRELPLRPGAPITVSSVVGVTRPGQLRRDFLEYVERERAHPYRPFLHYNSWYDIGYFSKYSEPEALDVIERFGTELHEKRDVVLSSFLFDDGWDDPKTLWGFHSGFPNGFTNVRRAAEKYGAEPGIWLSPWGGYGKPKQDRIAEATKQGFETNKGGFALSAPKYYQRFHDTCIDMIRQYGVNQFKIDGTGNVSSAYPGSAFDSDFDAALALIGDLRREKPDLFVNLTTGTFPSPFWLRYADSIWRGGEDHSFAGVGSDRQQWITYKDGDTFRGIVSKGPLFPLNSLMLHGLIYARHANKLNTDPSHDFRSEIQAYFGTGTQLQEMYVTPSLLSPDDWDSLAEAAKWARRQSTRLVDTHWIGGDPRQLEPYGHAAWTPEGGVLSLRNPSDKPQSISIDVEKAFELPPGAAHEYSARSPWAADRTHMPIRLAAGEPHTFELAPFQVLTLDANPR
ncbi:MAG TPA: enterotoxin, partial [Gemmatimonadaceae bacterium]